MKVLLFIFFFVSLYSQKNIASIFGYVLDENRQPIRYAQCYISGTNIGTQTDSTGYFSLTSVPIGQNKFVVQSIGYELFDTEITSVESKPNQITLILKSKEFSSETIHVRALNLHDWKKLFKRFKSLTLGRSNFADSCQYVNPEVIDFQKDGSNTIVTLSEPLILKNNMIGYTYYINFKRFKILKNYLDYYMTYYYKDTSTEKNKKIHTKRRDLLYYSSPKYFLKTLYHQAIENHDQKIGRQVLSVRGKRFKEIKFSEFYQKYLTDVHSLMKKLTLDFKKLTVSYNSNWKHSRSNKYSSITFIDNKDILIQPDGTLFNKNTVRYGGYFAYYKFSGLLPNNYKPSFKREEIINDEKVYSLRGN